MTLITPQTKDVILREILENRETGELAGWNTENALCGVSGNLLGAVINQFVKLGLFGRPIDRNGQAQVGGNGYVFFIVNVDAHDFLLRGGFYGQEELFKNTVERLLLQVEKLEAKDPEGDITIKPIREKIEKYISILANLASIGDGTDKLLG